MTTYGTAGKIVSSGLKQAKRVASGASKLKETTKKQARATAKRVAGRSTPGVGINPRGELSTGARMAGTGIERGVNTGDVTLGVLGTSLTYSPGKKDNYKIDYGFGTGSIESTREGCTITITVKLGEVITSTSTRRADDCEEPEPTPTPSPTPSPTPTPTPKPPGDDSFEPDPPPKPPKPNHLDFLPVPGWIVLENDAPAPLYSWSGRFIFGVYLTDNPEGYPSVSISDPNWNNGVPYQVTNTQIRIGSVVTRALNARVVFNADEFLSIDKLERKITEKNANLNKRQLTVNQPVTTLGSGQKSIIIPGLDATFLGGLESNAFDAYSDNFTEFTVKDFIVTAIASSDNNDSPVFKKSLELGGSIYWLGFKVIESKLNNKVVLLGSSNIQADVERLNKWGSTIPDQLGYQYQWQNLSEPPVLGSITRFKDGVTIVKVIYQENYYKPPLDPEKKHQQKPRNVKPMDNECCDLIEDIYELLGGDDFNTNGLEIPNHLFIPGGQGDTKAMTYNALLNLMFRTLDHRTVGEVEVSIKDNNIMKEGDQPLTMKLINATAATGKILELSQKQDSDLTAVLNLLMRLSWISVQILKVTNIASEGIKVVISYFDIPVKDKVQNIDIPVDPSLGGKVGFDPKKPTEDQLIKILDMDDPQKTISVFDKFMNNSKIPVKVKQFIGNRQGGNFWWLMDKNKK